MGLAVKNVGRCVVIRLPERLDMVLSASIEREIQEILNREKDSNVVLDMSDVKVISSSGLRVFITAKRKLKTDNRDLVICGINDDSINETFTVSRLFDVIQAYPTEEDAVKILDRQG